jgi:hypothetical protein
LIYAFPAFADPSDRLTARNPLDHEHHHEVEEVEEVGVPVPRAGK